ncbi:50S ribosomal protein L29 [Candidatus Roizmanbacteria bacterium]|nr:50S ribosomal protein L29 [Candidatus Roizmanbacteria bacterium]
MKKITKELQNKSVKELQKEAEVLRQEIAKLRLESGINPLKDTNVLIKKRKKLAVVLTLLWQKRSSAK